MKKKVLSTLLVAVAATSLLAGCGSSGKDSSSKGAAGKDITVVSREDGSGTRGAFIELFGIEEKNSKGEKVDNTTTEAMITNSTSVMMTTIGENDAAIGYISLGSLDDTVKAVKIDGAEASVKNVKAGKYKIVRPFNIVTKAKVSAGAQDFINYIMSKEGQKIVEDNGYITVDDNAKAYIGKAVKGKITVSGSSSVTPVMEKLKEAYEKANKDTTVEVQQSDSTTGVSNAVEGVSDIGMASRELADSETKKGVTAKAIAQDGIAVVVNKGNDITDLTSDQVKAIFTGKTTAWDDVLK
ncbi:MAG: substrate-binding domain-containing protein [Anaerostipes sp.]|jgi:phosphate transport system substrate-binding protein